MEIEKRLKDARVNAGLTLQHNKSQRPLSNHFFCFLQSQSYIPSAFLWAAHSMISVRVRYSG